MVSLVKTNTVSQRKICVLAVIAIFLMSTVSIYWQFWLLLDVFLAILLIMFFSNQFRNIFNIHSVVISLIVLYALPSSISILQGEIEMSGDKRLTLFSSFAACFIGYLFGVLFFRCLFPFRKRKVGLLPKKINALFWITYKHRYTLAIFVCIMLAFRGFLPRGMSYRESVTYRAETTGVIRYFNALLPTIFSSLMIAMVSITGDLSRRKRLSWLSYLLITLVALSIIGGHRIWIIAIFACLMLCFQPYLKRRHMICIVVTAFFATFIISGIVRYARRGETFSATAKNFQEYFVNIKDMSFKELMWKWNTFTLPFSTYLTIIENIPENVNFDYFAYIKDASFLIPTVLYPNRPLPHNIWYVKTFEPEFYHRGAGKTFYVLGFGYLFAGVPGVFVHLFLFGTLFEWLRRFFETLGTAASLFLYSYFFVQLLKFTVGYGFIVFVKNSIVLDYFVPIFLLFLLSGILDLLSPKKYRYKTAFDETIPRAQISH